MRSSFQTIIYELLQRGKKDLTERGLVGRGVAIRMGRFPIQTPQAPGWACEPNFITRLPGTFASKLYKRNVINIGLVRLSPAASLFFI